MSVYKGEGMKSFLSNILYLLLSEGEEIVSPLYDGITLIGPYAIGACIMLSSLWALFLGVKYAKAEDAGEKANLHKVLVNFCIGAVVVLVLLLMIYAVREPLVAYIG